MTIAVLFPGQGSQQVGMGRELVAHSTEARHLYQLADEIIGLPITHSCCHGDKEALRSTVIQQPALFVTSMVRWQMWSKQGMAVAYGAGHSMGQLTALTAAGYLTFEEGVQLAYERGQAMQAAGDEKPGRMAAVLKLSIDDVQHICNQVHDTYGGIVTIGNDNCPGQVVISGEKMAVHHATTLIKKQQGRVVELPITIASHSPLMETATTALQATVARLTISQPNFPIIGNLTATLLTTAEMVRRELIDVLTHRVRWHESMRWLIDHGSVDHMVDIGPSSVLSGLLKRIDPTVKRTAYIP